VAVVQGSEGKAEGGRAERIIEEWKGETCKEDTAEVKHKTTHRGSESI
jgi:hypothetical protein